MKTVVVDSQSVFDIAIESLGDVSAMFDLAESAGFSITDDLPTGQAFELPGVVNRQVADYFASRRVVPATAITIDSISGGGDLLLEGIEFWGIEYDFIVS